MTTRSDRMLEVSRAISSPGPRDEHRDDSPPIGSRMRIAEPSADQRDQHAAGRQDVAARMHRVGEQQLAVQRAPRPTRSAPRQRSRERDEHHARS